MDSQVKSYNDNVKSRVLPLKIIFNPPRAAATYKYKH